MIDEIIADIGTQVMAKLPYVTSVKGIGRQDPTGILVKERPEEWIGIDDSDPGRMYVRFRDGMDTVFQDAKLVSGKDITIVQRMRGVLMHTCDNEHELARYLAHALMASVNWTIRYKVAIKSLSTDKQYIFAQETKSTEGMRDDSLRLILVDFDIEYRDAVSFDPACVPTCHVC